MILAPPTVTLLLDAGHDEYGLPDHPALENEVVWNPHDGSSIPTSGPGSESLLKRSWERRFPRLVGRPFPLDYSWCVVRRVTGPLDALSVAYEALRDSVLERPSGDDDTFDYWPSGVRLARQVAADLDSLVPGPAAIGSSGAIKQRRGDRESGLDAAVRRLILVELAGFSGELLGKCDVI